MPEELKTAPRAKLVEIEFDDQKGATPVSGGKSLEVQFNPETLQVNYRNQKSGGDQQGSSGVQYLGRGSTSLSVDLLFDVTRPTGQGPPPDDVRTVTKQVNAFMTDSKNDNQNGGEYVPPGVRFVWGSFLFDGVMDSMNETLEFFDAEGRPLRATVSLSMSKQEIQFKQIDVSGGSSLGGAVGVGAGASVGAGVRAGVGGTSAAEVRAPGAEASVGTSVQQAAAAAGEQGRWKEIAEKSGVENPRSIHNPDALQM